MTGATTVATSRICPNCGAALSHEGPAGNCPNCLFSLAAALAPEAHSNPGAATLDTHRGHEPCAERRAPARREQAGVQRAGQEPGAPVPGQGATPAVLHYFGDYELLEEIARGGMGVVYRARQVSLNRVVAVKVLLFGQFASDEFVRRFRTEAEAAANLHHPNIVAIHEVGEHDGRRYFSMDYVEGGHLGDLMREQSLPARRAAALLQTIAEAVHHAHQRGVLHRDLKPSNILIDPEGQPRLTDFGLAKRLVGTRSTASETSPEKITDAVEGVPTSDLTVTGQMLGTPNYASPEQAGGRRGAVTAASDTYSLGAVLYFLLTGRPPFLGDSLEQTLDRVLRSDPVAPHLLNPSVPRDLETICLKCLEKEPRRRYGTAQELADELDRFLSGEPILARPVGWLERAWRWCRRKPALAASVAALLLVGAAGLAGILWQWHRAEANAHVAEQHATREAAQRIRAEEAVTLLELQRAEDLLEKDEVVMGVAYLARMVRRQPTNHIAAQRLLSALTQRSFALPVGPSLKHARKISYAEFSPDGFRVVTASLDLHASVWGAHMGELIVRLPHPDSVRLARLSPDNSRIVTVADDFQARLWDAVTGEALGQPMPHVKKIRTAEFSPDGQRVLTASDDGTVRMWDAQTGEPALEPLKHLEPVNSARFSPSGSYIVTASEDRTAQVWDARTGQRATKPFQHRHGVAGAEFSPDGKWIVSFAKDSSTCIWDASTGEPISKPMIHPDKVSHAHFSPEGQRVLTTLDSGVIQVWNARDWSPVGPPMRHRSWLSDAVFSPDGQRILSSSGDNTAILWDAFTGKPLAAPMEHNGFVESAFFTPDGRGALTASSDGSAQLWDVRPGAMRSQLLPEAARWIGACFSPDGEIIASINESGTAQLWNARTGREGPALSEAKKAVHLRFSPDGRRLSVHCADRTTQIWSVGKAVSLLIRFRSEKDIWDLKFSPDGRWLAISAKDGTLRQWNVESGEPRGEPIRHRAKIQFFTFSPDGQRLLSADNKEDQAWISDAASGRLLARTPARPGAIYHADFSPDGEHVATASEDGVARIWNSHSGEPFTEPLRHKASVLWIRFSRDGRRVVTASNDGTARLWDARTGQPAGEPMNHRVVVRSAEFSPDDRLVVTASMDGTARLWDATTGRPVAEPFVHLGQVHLARFSLDGRRLLTVSPGDGARAWDVPPVPRSADSLSAVSPTGSRQSVRPGAIPRNIAASAGYQPTTQQTSSLRYE